MRRSSNFRRSAKLYRYFPLDFLIASCQYIVMVCVYCGVKTHVTNSRPKKRTGMIWRRRYCDSCKSTFTTVETIDFGGSIVVTYKDGSFLPFQRDILFISIYNSLKHRKDALAAATALTDTILACILPLIHEAKLKRQDIVVSASKVLQRFDKAAGVQYLAYHPL